MPVFPFPGVPADEEALAELDLAKVPDGVPVAELLREVHEAFYEQQDD